MLAGELARLVVQAHYTERIHAPEHALDARRRHVAERQLGLSGDRLTEVALASAWRTLQEQTPDGLATHQLEALDAFEQGDNLAGRFENLRIALVVLETNTSFTWHQPVNTWASDEPEQDDELEDHHERDVEQLEDQVQARGDERPDGIPLRVDDEQAYCSQPADDE